MVSWLTEALVRRGHAVTLFASGDSRTSGTLVPVIDRAIRLAGPGLVDSLAAHIYAIGLIRERADEFDVVHSHLDYFPFPAFRHLSTPLITTLHGRLDLWHLPGVYRFYRELPLISTSNAQREPLPEANWAGTVYHGLPLDQYAPVGPGNGGYFVFLGRISPEKRPHVAIEVARRAGVRLAIAAKVDAVDQQYFSEVVVPLLRDPHVEFIGEADETTKRDLLRNATGLLLPILWPEPFGLAMIEAMAYGTPVVTRRCGSTLELIAHGEVGYLCDDDDELVNAVKKVEQLDRAACRRWVEERFSVDRMAADYEAIYRRLIERRRKAA